MSDLLERVAGAPITWGVDESPGWGYLMDRDRVLTEMLESGLTATELGPDGYLPTDPVELREYLARFQMSVIGGFVPALLYRPDRVEEELAYVTRAATQLSATGSQVLVLGPSSHNDGYDLRYDLTEEEWPIFFANLQRLEAIADGAGLRTALHPHWSMAIEDGADVDRLLAHSTVDLCLDTGHLYLADTDPVEVARAARGRVIHVHLKDVDPGMAAKVASGEALFRQSVIDGLFVPLGEGGVDIAGTIRALEADGYRGWYVLEQDVSLAGEPARGEGPKADAIKSVEYLRRLSAELPVAVG